MKVKTAIANLITLPAVGRSIARLLHNKIKIRGITVDTSSPLIQARVKAMLFWQLYESAEIRFVKRYLPPETDVVELGSSIGVVGSIAGRIIQGQRLVCVEAQPEFIPVIRRNLEINGVKNFMVLNYAISNEDKTVFFTSGGTNLTGKVGTGQDKQLSVKGKKLSSILKEMSIGRFALIADIEGAELQILIDDPRSLGQCHCIIIETHQAIHSGKTYSPADIQMLIEDLNFKLIDRYGPVMVFIRPNP